MTPKIKRITIQHDTTVEGTWEYRIEYENGGAIGGGWLTLRQCLREVVRWAKGQA